MFRRSRFSVRPNVGTAGRTVAAVAPQEAPSANQESSEIPKDVSESKDATAEIDKSEVTPPDKAAASGDGIDQNGEGASSSAAVQRRKRFSIKPKVAPGRPTILSRTPKSPAKAVSETPVEVSGSDLNKPLPSTSSQTGNTATAQGLQSLRRRRSSEGSKQPRIQPKPILISSDSSGPSAVSPAEDSLEQTQPPADSSKQSENMSGSQIKEVPARLPDKVPPSLPDKETIEISEKAKTLVSTKGVVSLTPSAYSLSRLLNGPSDLQRLVKAQKLRELLRQERRKEKNLKKAKARIKEYSLDPAKMTMRDLIRYLPTTNPMSSSLEDSFQENETVVPPSPGREESPERAQEPEVPPNMVNSREEEEEEAEEDQEEALMVPQVKVAEDGSLIIDEMSLTVEVQRAKGPNPAQNRDPIFERGSTTTYSSFRKGNYSKPWSSEETDMFFLAVSMVGTDFSMICQLFPHRARSEIKNKFKKEERENSWRIDKAFRERRKLDIEYFSKLLEKILEFQKNRKKLKSLVVKNSPKKHKRKAKGKKSARRLSDVEEGEEEDEDQVPDLEQEGEKENEDLCNEGGVPAAEPKRKNKRKNRTDVLTEEPNDKKSKTGKQSTVQVEAGIREAAEAAVPEGHTESDISEKTQNASPAKDTAIKPAKLSRSRAPKLPLPLGRKWGKKPQPSTKSKDAVSDKGDESASDGASEEQVSKETSPVSQAQKRRSASDDVSSEEEDDATVKPPRPTRYGRIPKPTKPLTYPANDTHSSASEASPASEVGSSASAAKSKPKCMTKRRRPAKPKSPQQSKKPKLITLRASQSELSNEESENPWEDEYVEEGHLVCCSSKDSTAPVFVPASLHTPQPMVSVVDDAMVELDILASMPDVLGISQEALCPDSTCEQAQHETGTAEPCEHQLDLLVDVIDFLSSEHTEESEDQSYNEAAQTLLTIGNVAHVSQPAQNETAIQDYIAETAITDMSETSNLGEGIASRPATQEESATSSASVALSQELTDTSETAATVELQDTATENDDMAIDKTSNQMCEDQKAVCELDPTPQLQSNPESSNRKSPQTKKGSLSKPKPNLGGTQRTAQPKSQPDPSTVRAAEETNLVAPTLCQGTETLPAAEETALKLPDYTPTVFKDDNSCTEVKLTEESYQERFVSQVESSAAIPDQNSSEIQSHHFSESQFKSRTDQTTNDTNSTSESINENLSVGTPETGLNKPLTSEAAITEVEQGSDTSSAHVQESSNTSVPSVSPAEDLPFDQKGGSEVTSSFQSRRSRLQKIKPKLNLAQTSRIVRSQSQTAKEPAEDSSPRKSTRESTSVFTDENLTPLVQTTGSILSNVSKTDAGITESPVGLGSNVDSAPVQGQEDRDQPAVSATHAEELPASHQGGEVASSSQLRRNQLQKIKPTPNLPQTSRIARSKPQTTKEPVEKDSSPRKSTRESTSVFTDENLTSHVQTSESILSNVLKTDSGIAESPVGQGSNVDSAPVQGQEDRDQPAVSATHAEELPASQEEGEVAFTPQLRRSRLQKVKPTPNLPQKSRNVRSKPQITKESAEKDSTPNPILEVEPQSTCTLAPEKQSQCTDTASVVIQNLSFSLDSTLIPKEELATNEGIKTCAGLVDQVDLGAATSNQSATDNQKFSDTVCDLTKEHATADTEPTFRITDRNLSTHIQTTEGSHNHEVKTDLAVTESQDCQGLNVDTVQVQEDHDQLAVSATHVEELPASQDKDDVAATSQLRRSQFQKVKPKPNLSQTRTVKSKPQPSKDPATLMQHLEKTLSPTSKPESTDNTIAEAQPTCTTTQPEKSSQITSTGSASVSLLSLKLGSTHKNTEELSSAEVEKKDVECGILSSSEGSEENVLQRRRRLPKVKPNLRSSTRTTVTKLQSDDISRPSEHCHVDTSSSVTSKQLPPGDSSNTQTGLKLTEKDDKDVTPAHCLPKAELTSVKYGPVDSEKSPESTNNKDTSSVAVLIATSQVVGNESVLTNSAPENKSSQGSTVEIESPGNKISINDPVVACPASQEDCTLDASTRATEPLSQQITDPTAVSDVQSSCSWADAQSELTDAPKTSKKPPQTRRGRLIKPKPSLGCRSRPQPQQTRNTTPAPADFGGCSQSVDACVGHKPVSEVRADTHEPIEGVIVEPSKQDSSPNDAASSFASLTQVVKQQSEHESPFNDAQASLGCVPQVFPTQNPSISSTEVIQSFQVFPDMLPEQVPSDPDEPFFILSLTEIPVSSSGEVVNSGAEHLAYLPVTDTSIQQPSTVSGGSLVTVGDGCLSNIPVSTDESGFLSLIDVKDIGTEGSPVRNPKDPQESTVVEPPKLTETEDCDEATVPPTKQRLTGTGRRAKLQVKANTTGRKRTSQALAAMETQSIPTQDSEHPGPSERPEPFDDIVTESHKQCGGNGDINQEPLISGRDPESSSGAQATQSIGPSGRNRKSKDKNGPSSSPPPDKAALKGSRAKTPFVKGKWSLPEPVASKSHVAVPTPSFTQQPKETHSAVLTSPTQPEVDIELISDHSPSNSDPHTSQCKAEVSASQQSISVESSSQEEEPTNVSQYFLSDIFTEVEEG